MITRQARHNEPTKVTSSPQRICLFGGTFDPIHLGHIHIAHAAIESQIAEQIVFLPCRQSPHKQGQQHVSEYHRLKMCELATEDYHWAVTDDFDLTAQEPCYSWRTAEAMQNKYPNSKLYWLMGTDQWDTLPQWNRSDYLAQLVDFIVFERGGPVQQRHGMNMQSIHGNHPASATAIRDGLSGAKHLNWLHPKVLHYISQNSLYGYKTELPKADD